MSILGGACIQKASLEDATDKILQIVKDSNEFSEKLENQAGRQEGSQSDIFSVDETNSK